MTKSYTELMDQLKENSNFQEKEKLNFNKNILFPLFEDKEERDIVSKTISSSDSEIDDVLDSIDIIGEQYVSYLLSSKILKEQKEEEEDEEEPVPEDEPESEPEEEPAEDENDLELEKQIDQETDQQKKEKLQVLQNIIRHRLIYKFANTPVDVTRITRILTNFITRGKDETDIKNELDQRSFIDFSLDVFNVLLKNKRLASLVGLEAMLESVDSITESKKQKRKRKRRTRHPDTKVTPTLDMLLRLGLVDQKIYIRAKRALLDKRAAGSITIFRNLLFDILNSIVHYIQKDPLLYNRMRINVMKEAKNSLPGKGDLIMAYESGRACKQKGFKESYIPEEFSKDEFLKEAWYKGYRSC